MSGYVFPVLGGGSFSSGLGRRSAPVAGASTNHAGIDIRGTRGTPVLSTTAGQRVTRAYKSASYGNVVFTKGEDGIERRYAHLDSIGVQTGSTLGAGQQLGTLGSTGRSSGNHLHYEERDSKGNVLNPSSLLGKAKRLLNSDAGRAGLAAATGGTSAAVFAVTDTLGLTGGQESWLDQFKKWITESGFFQRMALALVAFILLFAAFYLLKSNVVQEAAKTVKGLV